MGQHMHKIPIFSQLSSCDQIRVLEGHFIYTFKSGNVLYSTKSYPNILYKIKQNSVLHAIYLTYIHWAGGFGVQSVVSDGETDGLHVHSKGNSVSLLRASHAKLTSFSFVIGLTLIEERNSLKSVYLAFYKMKVFHLVGKIEKIHLSDNWVDMLLVKQVASGLRATLREAHSGTSGFLIVLQFYQ